MTITYYASLRADGSGRAAGLYQFDHVPDTNQLPASPVIVVQISAAQYNDWNANPHTRAWINGAVVIVASDLVFSIPQRTVVDRLITAGLLRAANAALLLEAPSSSLTDAQFNLRTRWNAGGGIMSNDPDTLAVFAAIGADPAVILAPP